MGYCDFVVEDKPTEIELAYVIIQHLLIHRLINKKPTIILLTGESGEGKSYTALKIAECILKYYDLNLEDFLDDIEIFTPLQYRDKMDRLLHDKRLKKVKVVILDEAREVVSSKDWFSFINRSIADINASFRTLKPMVVIIVTQFTGDVDKAIRRSINFWGKCSRPLWDKARLSLYRKWQDEYDIENPKMRKRRIFGYVKRGNKRIKLKPTFVFNKPSKDVIRKYEKLNREAKTRIIKMKLDALLKMLEKDLTEPFEKAETMAEFYVNKPELLPMVIDKRGGKIVLKREVSKMHDLSKEEKKEFHRRLVAKLVERGIAYADKKSESDKVEKVG